MDLESTIVRTRVRDDGAGGGVELTDHGIPEIDRSSDDEIDAFLAKFDETGADFTEPAPKRRRNGRKKDDTDDIIRRLEEMAPVEDDNDWGRGE